MCTCSFGDLWARFSRPAHGSDRAPISNVTLVGAPFLPVVALQLGASRSRLPKVLDGRRSTTRPHTSEPIGHSHGPCRIGQSLSVIVDECDFPNNGAITVSWHVSVIGGQRRLAWEVFSKPPVDLPMVINLLRDVASEIEGDLRPS